MGMTADGATIRPATSADAATLARVGARLFTETYGPTHPEPELGRYLVGAFGEATIRRALARPDTRFLLVEDAHGEAAGYAWLQEGDPADPRLRRPGQGLEIQRFYLGRPWQGRGVAQALMAECRREAGRRGAGYLWLQVWQQAPWAIRFYEKAGFRIAGPAVFEWGERQDQDWLMVAEV